MAPSVKKIKVGICGLGRAGMMMHVPELEQHKAEFEVVAGCDIEQDRLDAFQARFPKAKTYLDNKKFLADDNIELVSVAVRSPQHVDYAIRALKAGKYVFAEKPVALSSAGLKKLEKAAKEHPGKLFCRHNRRFEAAFNHIFEIIHSGILGEVYEIKLCRHSFRYRDDWQTLVGCGGGQLNNWGPHLIDHGLRFLESPLASLWSDLKRNTALGDAEDHMKVLMRGKNGRVIDIEISDAVTIPAPVYTVYGTRGTLISDNEQDIRLIYLAPDYKPPKAKAHPETMPINEGFGVCFVPKWIRKTIMVEPSAKCDINDIYHWLFLAIRKGKAFPVKLEEAFDVVRVSEMIKKQNPQFPLKDDVFGCEKY